VSCKPREIEQNYSLLLADSGSKEGRLASGGPSASGLYFMGKMRFWGFFLSICLYCVFECIGNR